MEATQNKNSFQHAVGWQPSGHLFFKRNKKKSTLFAINPKKQTLNDELHPTFTGATKSPPPIPIRCRNTLMGESPLIGRREAQWKLVYYARFPKIGRVESRLETLLAGGGWRNQQFVLAAYSRPRSVVIPVGREETGGG